MKTCRVCGGTYPEAQFATHGTRPNGTRKTRTFCRDCYNQRSRERERMHPADRPIEHFEGAGPVGDPVLYGLALIFNRAVRDLAAFGRVAGTKGGRMEGAISQDPFGCDSDAKDALRWLQEFGADFCELMDRPREWAAQAIEERMGEGA